MAIKIKLAKQYNFEFANKSGKWLAYRLCKESAKNIIHNLRDDKQIEYSDRKNIEPIVRKFYSSLYTSTNPDIKQIKEYLEKHQKTRITEDSQKKTNTSFTPMEIREALKHQKKGKTPGPDSIIIECYDALEKN